MGKLIFLDVDGTLAIPHQGISDRVKQAIHDVRKNGHLVFVCTGRNKVTLSQELHDIPFDGWIISAGAYIVLNGEVILDKSMPLEEVRRLTGVFDAIGIQYNFECNEHTYMDEAMAYNFSLREKLDETNPEMVRQFEAFKKDMGVLMMDEFERHPEGVKKMTWLAQNMNQIEQLKSILSNDYEVVIHKIFSDDKFFNGEIIPKNIGKGKAIEKVVSSLGARMEDTIGFGDSMNDYEMITTVHLGICMENGSDDLKAVSDRICESVYDDGVYHEFKRLKLI